MSEPGKPWRNLARVWKAPFLDWWIVSVLASALYPTLFALSANWYALSATKIAWLLAVVGATLPLTAYFLVRFVGQLFTLAGPKVATAWRSYLEPGTFALLCSGFLFLLFGGALQALFPSPIAHIAIFALFAALLARLFIRGRQRYFNLVLLALILVAGVTWIGSFASYKVSAATAVGTAGSESLANAPFVERPNIYFFIYDAYGSEDAYLRGRFERS